MANEYAIIMAGGSGTRLWPLSRRDKPKQVLKLAGDRSLLGMSFDRLRAMLPTDRIIVIGSERHRAACLTDLPELAPDNYIGEPAPRDTAAAVGLSAAVIAARDPLAVLGVFTADHVIRPVERFCEVVRRGYAAAQEHADALITFGIRPSAPLTSYGYIQRGDSLGPGVYQVRRFTEKPTLETARRFLATGDYAWNSGMFCWRAATILRELQHHLPATHDAVTRAAAEPSRLSEIYDGLQRISIDYAVMEKAEHVYTLDMNVEWVDVGSWPSLQRVRPVDGFGNVLAAPRVVAIDSSDCVIFNEDEHLIAAIGLTGIVVVRTPDATLICRADEAEKIKAMLPEIEKRFGEGLT